jgi:hypothetical protein
MSVQEVLWRISDYSRQRVWSRQQVSPPYNGGPIDQLVRDQPGVRIRSDRLHFTATLPEGALRTVPATARVGVIATADEVLAGRWPVFGMLRDDLTTPDWFLDPVTRIRAPQRDYCFRIDHRDVQVTGNVKHVWELSRLHHVTVLAGAYALSREEKYAEGAARHLRSWWQQNPFLSGVHWTSGIEVGLRLLSWVWVRRLLDGWEGAPRLFEDNETSRRQIWWHQRYLAAFRSRGSSANNHVIAEAAGQLIAALAFDWFSESEEWAVRAAELFEAELARNTFPSGVNREMAFDYHGFVAELGLLAASEAQLAGRPVSERSWSTLCRMLDVIASVVDVRLRAPRQGDSDDGRALILGCPEGNRWAGLLALGRAVFGAKDWWPACDSDATSVLVASIAGSHPRADRPGCRESHFADAGLTIMRSAPSDGKEIWCRCDAGPHGFLSIAAHAHADALAVEVRHDGVDILADPGTYCYNSEPTWRSYFKSTLAHNTIELGHRDQSRSGGPTLWLRHAETTLIDLGLAEDGRTTYWSAEHDGYTGLRPPAWHRRTVQLLSEERRIEIVDRIRTAGRHTIRLAFHLGPTVRAVSLEASVALSWTSEDGTAESATLSLPRVLTWSVVRGSTDPLLGWYSSGFGRKQPATTVLGEGVCAGHDEFLSVLQFAAGGSTG